VRSRPPRRVQVPHGAAPARHRGPMTAPTRSNTAPRRPTIVRGALASALRPTARTAEIEVHEPDARPRTVTVDDALVVGRETQGLQLLDASVSRRHLVLRVRRGAP